jgi:putative membrane protein insertion efficiency factor
MKSLLITLVKLYRRGISPFFASSCRFHPTCSSYMIEALDKHGVMKGLWLGIKRLLKCHPYYKGDFVDEVPSDNKRNAGKPCKVDCQ